MDLMEDIGRTPLYEEHLALGGRMIPFAGYEMPVQYVGIIEEHRAVRAHAGLFDISHMAAIRLSGPEVTGTLQGMLTNDIHMISEVGRAQYTLLCAEDGGIIDDLIVYHTGDREYLVIPNASNRQAVLDLLIGNLPQGNDVVDESSRTALMALQGPKALRVLRELAGGGWGPPSRFRIAPARLDTVDALVARTGYTGEDGVEIVCHASSAPGLWRAMLSFSEVTPCGLGARDTLRLEMGYPLYGNDLDRGTDPVSAGLDWVVDMDKGDFTGREAIARVMTEGPATRLSGLLVEDGIPRPGFPVLRDGDEVGKVASGTYSPTLGHGIATVYLPVDITPEGTRVDVVIRKKIVPAVVKRPPFVTGTSLEQVQ